MGFTLQDCAPKKTQMCALFVKAAIKCLDRENSNFSIAFSFQPNPLRHQYCIFSQYKRALADDARL